MWPLITKSSWILFNIYSIYGHTFAHFLVFCISFVIRYASLPWFIFSTWTPACVCVEPLASGSALGSTHQRTLRGVCPPPSCSRIPTLAAPTCDAHTPLQYSSVQSLSRVWLFATPWTATRQASLSITNSQSLLKLMSIESMMPSNHLILCCPLLVLPPIPPSIRVFLNESALRIRWPKNWSFSFNISPSNEYSGLISFGMDWLDLLAVQETLKSLLQHHSSKASILWCSAFFTVQLSHPYMTTGKTIALTRWTFVGKIMALLFNMLSRLVITFLPRSKRLLISWLQSPSAVILKPPKNKVWHCFYCLPIYLPWSDGTRCYDLSFLNVEI